MANLKKTILGLVGDRILQKAQVHSIEIVSEHFKFITLTSSSFTNLNWKPGEKIQINTGGWNVRTYTPLSFDSSTRQLRVMAFLHGNGPGSRWAQQAKPGDACQVLGPRPSLRLSDSSLKSLIFLGDETALAAAATCQKFLGPQAVLHFIFEVSAPLEGEQVCGKLGLLQTKLVKKEGDGSHLRRAFEHVQKAVEVSPHAQLILTGNAKSIQDLRSRLRDINFAPARMLTKAYWSPGKEGLD